MTGTIRRSIEHFLYRQRFAAPVVRHLLATQIMVAASGMAISLATFWFTLWPAAFTVGALITASNFWHIARFAESHVGAAKISGISFKYFLLFLFRLVITGAVLFWVIVIIKAPLLPLLAGLVSSVAAIVLWGVSRLHGKPAKEV